MMLWLPLSLVIIISLGAGNLWLLLRVYSPLKRLCAQTEDLAQGHAAAFQNACGGIPEIESLRHSLASMARHVGRSHEENLTYRSALTNGQEAERGRIAHELHDDTVQSLIAIAQSLDMAAAWLEREPTRAASMLAMARQQTVETVNSVRRMIANLRPPALEELGLVPALKMMAEDIPTPSISITSEGAERRLEEAQELALFRSAQEAIHNAQKYSRAQHMSVTVVYEPAQIRMNLCDDGIGFKMPEHLDDLARSGHYGIVGMAERVQSLEGQIKIHSAPNRGVQIQISLPLNSTNQPTESVRDPVCGAVIPPQQAYGSVIYEDERYYFCCPVCQGAFQRQPETYIAQADL